MITPLRRRPPMRWLNAAAALTTRRPGLARRAAGGGRRGHRRRPSARRLQAGPDQWRSAGRANSAGPGWIGSRHAGMSTLFLRTLREDPADAEVPATGCWSAPATSAGRRPGIYSWLPLGYGCCATSSGSSARRWTRSAPRRCTSRRCCRASPTRRAPLDRVRRQHLPAQGPQGRRLPARADPRGDVHAAGQGPVLVVQGPAAVDSTRSRPSTATRRGRAPACCAAASS